MAKKKKAGKAKGGAAAARAEARKRAAAMTRDRARARQAGGTYLSTSLDKWKPRKKATISILPYTVCDKNHPEDIPKGDLWYRRPFQIHRNVGPENELLVCPKSINKPCPICEEVARLSDNYEDNEDLIKEIRAKTRDLYLVYDHKEEEVALMDISKFCFGEELDQIMKESTEDAVAAFWFDDEEGLDLNCTFKKKKLGKNEFYEIAAIDFEERDEPIDEDIMEQVECLDRALVIKDYDTIEAMFLGNVSSDEAAAEDDDDEDDAPAKKSKKGKKSKGVKWTKAKVKKLTTVEDLEDLDDDELEALAEFLDCEEDLDDIMAELGIEPDEEDEDDEDVDEDDEDEDDEEEEDEDEDDEDEFDDMSRKELIKAAKAAGLKPLKKHSDDDLRDMLREADDVPFDEDDEDEEEEEKPKKPKKGGKGKKSKPKKGGKGKCPHGHTWAEDCDEHEDCDTCDSWSECRQDADDL